MRRRVLRSGRSAWETVERVRAALDKLHEECGIFGIYGHPEASTLTQLGLFCCAGLLVSVLLMSYGLDLSPGFF